MKKRIKRNNYILFGAIAVAAVALSGVGFATWITGMQKLTDDDNTITIKVDTAKNDTLYIDAAIDINDSSIYLGEASTEQSGNSIYIYNNSNPELLIKEIVADKKIQVLKQLIFIMVQIFTEKVNIKF